MARTRTGDYRLRILVLSRVLANPDATGEQQESWPDPPAGRGVYFASREGLTGGETIAQAVRQTTGTQKLRVRGRNLPIYATDRVRATVGQITSTYHVTGVSNDFDSTVLTLERVALQQVPAWGPAVNVTDVGSTWADVSVVYPPAATSITITATTISGTVVGTVTLTAGATTWELTGLTAGITYLLQAQASNWVGLGPLSAIVAVTPPEIAMTDAASGLTMVDGGTGLVMTS